MNDMPGPPERRYDKGLSAALPSAAPELEEIDDIDFAILDQLRTIYDVLDPPPPDLADRVRFCLALDNLNVEISRLQRETLVGSGARSTERTRTITFDSTNLTIMVSIVEMAGDEVRLDGWLAPARPLRVELRVAGASPNVADVSHFVETDDTGRFVFCGVRHGLAQLLVHPLADGMAEGLGTIVTPSLML
ncbi:MAG TPA: hypothetical protein VFC19_11050 [Candidatus Limnocylindrales bacterium]|nr:hypothetical protein [Candidatus Limnocylindrales bacterium]